MVKKRMTRSRTVDTYMHRILGGKPTKRIEARLKKMNAKTRKK